MGGAEINMLNIIKYISKRGMKANIMLLKNKIERLNIYKPLFKSLKIYSVLKSDRMIHVWKLPFIYIYSFFYLIVHIKKYRYKIVVAVEEFTFLPTIVLSYFTNIKTVLLVGNNVKEGFINTEIGIRKYFVKKMFRWILNKATKIVCVSYGLKAQLIDEFQVSSSKISVIYNGVDIISINRLKNKRLPKVLSNKILDSPTCVLLGRLVKKKGHILALNIFEKVLKSIPTARCIIMGTGPEEINIKQYINKHKLQKSIILTGLIDNPYEILSKANVFLFTSLYEGFGNTIIEAMACGVPVISSNCLYGPLEILSGKADYSEKNNSILYSKYGILFPNNAAAQYNLDQIANIIIHLMKSKDLKDRYSTKSIERSKMFSSTNMTHHYYTIFKGL